MLINKQIKNILYSYDRFKTKNTHNIFYNRASSLFDLAINEFPNSMINIIDMAHNDNLMNKVCYSAIWINDILNYSQHIVQFAEFYTGQILCIHDPPTANFKKEDIAILKSNLNRYRFLSFCPIANLWLLDRVIYKPYGVLPLTHHIEKSKDILILNFRHQKQVDMLYQYTKQAFPNTDICDQPIKDIESAQKLISKYRVCIDFDSYYNLIVANSCGTVGVGASYSVDENIYQVSGSQELFAALPNLLNTKDYDTISQTTIKKYNWQKFCENVYDYFLEVFNEGLIV